MTRSASWVPLRRHPPLGCLLAAVAAVAAAALVLTVGGPSASAVQTPQWGIAAAPVNGVYHPEIIHSADGATVQTAVLVWNRTHSRLTVHLSVLSVVPENGTFAYLTKANVLSSGISIPLDQVTLAAGQEARMVVRIKEPRSYTTLMAAISGESRPVQEGDLSVEERLAVLVQATGLPRPPGGSAVPGGVPGRSTGDHPGGLSRPVLFFGSIGAAVLAVVLFFFDWERRRKDEELAAEAAARFALTDRYLASLPPPSGPPVSPVPSALAR